jgi:hypothetical protein
MSDSGTSIVTVRQLLIYQDGSFASRLWGLIVAQTMYYISGFCISGFEPLGSAALVAIC